MANLVKAECQYCEEITLHINGECSVCGDFYNGAPKQKIKKDINKQKIICIFYMNILKNIKMNECKIKKNK